MTRFILFISIFLLSGYSAVAQDTEVPGIRETKAEILAKINKIRAKGCRCGRKRMQPTHSLTWSHTLTVSAVQHAAEMHELGYFAHQSAAGLDVGDRLDALDYKWQFVGENLAEGQKTLDEAIRDWMKSKSHCMMIMNPDMKEMGMAKVGKYWVNHFGALMPANTKRIRTYYREGE